MKHIIPIQEIKQIEIECISYNVLTSYYYFSIKINGSVSTEIKLTSYTLDAINNKVKEIVKTYEEANS